MVSLTTSSIKTAFYTICLACFIVTHYCPPIKANIFDKIGKGFKKAGESIKKTAEKAGKDIEKTAKKVGGEIKKAGDTAVDAIGDRFKDTKLTRAADYAARKAALETALATANGTLTATKTIVSGTLATTEKSAKLALSGAEAFLSDVVKQASPALLKAAATTAKTTIEATKITTVATLKGTTWVVKNSVDQITIRHLRYTADLKSLEKGVLGNVICEGTFFGKDFKVAFDLDPRDISSIKKSIKPILNALEEIFNKNIADPIVSAGKDLAKATHIIADKKPAPATQQKSQQAGTTIDSLTKEIDTATKQLELLDTTTSTTKK